MDAAVGEAVALSGWHAAGMALCSSPNTPPVIRPTLPPEEVANDGDKFSTVSGEIGSTPEPDVKDRVSNTGMYALISTPRAAQQHEAFISNTQHLVTVMSVHLPDELGEMVLIAPRVSERAHRMRGCLNARNLLGSAVIQECTQELLMHVCGRPRQIVTCRLSQGASCMQCVFFFKQANLIRPTSSHAHFLAHPKLLA